MKYGFYSDEKYKKRQSVITKENWKKGTFNFLYKREKRQCLREGCNKEFKVKMSDLKVYCGRACAAKVNNKKRGSFPEEVKQKISKALKGRPNIYKGIKKIVQVQIKCNNPKKVLFNRLKNEIMEVYELP